MGGASTPIIKTKWSFFHSNLNEKTEFKKYIEIKKRKQSGFLFYRKPVERKREKFLFAPRERNKKPEQEKREQEEQGL